jgi:hypothetical protein
MAATRRIYQKSHPSGGRKPAQGDDLGRLNEEAREQSLKEKDAEAEKQMQRQVAKLLRIVGQGAMDLPGSKKGIGEGGAGRGRRGPRPKGAIYRAVAALQRAYFSPPDTRYDSRRDDVRNNKLTSVPPIGADDPRTGGRDRRRLKLVG